MFVVRSQLAASLLHRYWLAGTYEERHAAGQEPQNVDKEFLRLWFRQNCDPYKDEVCASLHTIHFPGIWALGLCPACAVTAAYVIMKPAD
jgi:hypothetical protein